MMGGLGSETKLNQRKYITVLLLHRAAGYSCRNMSFPFSHHGNKREVRQFFDEIKKQQTKLQKYFPASGLAFIGCRGTCSVLILTPFPNVVQNKTDKQVS